MIVLETSGECQFSTHRAPQPKLSPTFVTTQVELEDSEHCTGLRGAPQFMTLPLSVNRFDLIFCNWGHISGVEMNDSFSTTITLRILWAIIMKITHYVGREGFTPIAAKRIRIHAPSITRLHSTFTGTPMVNEPCQVLLEGMDNLETQQIEEVFFFWKITGCNMITSPV